MVEHQKLEAHLEAGPVIQLQQWLEQNNALSDEELAVIEAMKMENSLRALADGVVKIVSAEVGDSLKVDQPIVEFE